MNRRAWRCHLEVGCNHNRFQPLLSNYYSYIITCGCLSSYALISVIFGYQLIFIGHLIHQQFDIDSFSVNLVKNHHPAKQPRPRVQHTCQPVTATYQTHTHSTVSPQTHLSNPLLTHHQLQNGYPLPKLNQFSSQERPDWIPVSQALRNSQGLNSSLPVEIAKPSFKESVESTISCKNFALSLESFHFSRSCL